MTCAIRGSLAECCRHLTCLSEVSGVHRKLCLQGCSTPRSVPRWQLAYIVSVDRSWFMPRLAFLFLVILSPKTWSEVAVLRFSITHPTHQS